MKNHKVYGVIACAGSGERAKQNQNKLFALIDGETVIHKTVKTFNNSRHIDEIIIIYRDGELEKIKEEVDEYLESGEIEELADIEEVLRAILDVKHYSYDDFDNIRKRKVERKGAFKNKIFLESTN